MESWEVVQKNKITGKEKVFLSNDFTSQKTAELGAKLRRMLVSADKYDVFVRKKQ